MCGFRGGVFEQVALQKVDPQDMGFPIARPRKYLLLSERSLKSLGYLLL